LAIVLGDLLDELLLWLLIGDYVDELFWLPFFNPIGFSPRKSKSSSSSSITLSLSSAADTLAIGGGYWLFIYRSSKIEGSYCWLIIYGSSIIKRGSWLISYSLIIYGYSIIEVEEVYWLIIIYGSSSRID